MSFLTNLKRDAMFRIVAKSREVGWDNLTQQERSFLENYQDKGGVRLNLPTKPWQPSESFAKYGGALFQVAGMIAGAALLGPAIGGVFGAAAGTTAASVATAVGASIGGLAGGLANQKIVNRYNSWLAEQQNQNRGNLNDFPFEFGGWGGGGFSMPGLLDHTSMDGQRLGDLSVQSSAFGRVRPEVFGTKRLAAELIWSRGMRDLKDVSTEADGHVTVTTWKYYLTAMWELCRNDANRITAVRQIYLDNKLVYDRTSDTENTITTDPSFLAWTGSVPDSWSTSGTVTKIETDLDPELTGAVAAAGLAYGAGVYQSITIASAGVQHRVTIRCRSNLWTQVQVAVGGTTLPWLRCPGGGKWTTIQTTWTPSSAGAIELRVSNLSTPGAVLVVGSVNVTQGVGATGEEDPVDFEINLGEDDQAVPGVLKANHPWGEDWTPAYVGAVTIAVSDLPLEKYGNHVPRLEAVVEEISQTTGDVVERIVEMVSPETVVDVSELDQEIGGYFINARSTAQGVLDPLRLAYQFEVLEDPDGVLIFRRVADRTIAVEIDPELLDVRPFGTAPGALVSISATTDELLPNTVDVGFVEDDRNQETGEARSSLFGVSGSSSTSYNFPIVGDSDTFRSIALRLHAISLTERRSYSARADARLLAIEPTDLVSIDGVPVRIRNIRLDGFGRLSISGTGHYSRAYTLTANGATVDVNLSIPAVGG